MKTTHYVANLIIKRVEVEDGRNANGSLSNSIATSRKVGDVISLVVRGGELEDLKQQLKDHLLIARDDISVPLDEHEGKVTR
jgi:hypothetical protein